MAITIRKINHRPWPVTVKLQTCNEADGSVVAQEHTFIAHWKAFTEADLKTLFATAEARFPAVDAEEAVGERLADGLKKNAFVFGELLTGWSKVQDETGCELPYSRELLTEWVCGADGLAVSGALNVSLSEVRFGVAPAKNSLPSPAPGEVPVADEGVGETWAN